MCKFLFKLTLIVVLLLSTNTVVFGNVCDPDGPDVDWWCDRDEAETINAYHESWTFNARFPAHLLYCYTTGDLEYFTVRNMDVYTGWFGTPVATNCAYGNDTTPIEFYPDIYCRYHYFSLYFNQGDTCEDTYKRLGRFCSRGIRTVSSQYSGCNFVWQSYLNDEYNHLSFMYGVPLYPGGTLLFHLGDVSQCDCE